MSIQVSDTGEQVIRILTQGQTTQGNGHEGSNTGKADTGEWG